MIRGGGTLAATKSNISAARRADLEQFFESTWIQINAARHADLLIGTVYIPPKTPLSEYHSWSNGLAEKLNSFHGEIIILGDLNFHFRENDNEEHRRRDTHIHNVISTAFASIDLNQLATIKNQSGHTLDQVWVSHAGVTVSRSRNPLVSEDSYHPALEISVPLGYQNVSRWLLRPNYQKADFHGLYCTLRDTDWEPLYLLADANSAAEFFVDAVSATVQQFVPLKRVRLSCPHPSWFSAKLKLLLKLKRKYHRKFKKTGRPLHYLLFSRCRQLVKQTIAFDASSLHNLLSKDRRLCHAWAASADINVKNRKRLSPTDFPDIPDRTLANDFATHFVSSQSNNLNWNPTHRYLSYPLICTPQFTVEETRRITRQLKPSLFPGPDAIPPLVIKGCADVLSTPLTHVINLSLSTSTYPDIWKRAFIIPLHKTGPRKEISNYRPISILSSCAKILDKLLAEYINPAYNQYIDNRQHGFVRGRSVETNLMTFTHSVSHHLERGGQLDTLYIDLSKAFDRVNHQLLFQELDFLGCSPALLKWFNSYLSNRTNQVNINGCLSIPYHNSNGVPQGSVLGPMLFNIAINSIFEVCHHSTILMYADDLKISYPIHSVEDSCALQDDLDNVSSWCNKHGFSINTSKTEVMSYTRKKHPIKTKYILNNTEVRRSTCLKDLGVVFTPDLRLKEHITRTTKKAQLQGGRILRATQRFPSNAVPVYLFRSLVVPILNYASVIWNGLPQYLDHEINLVYFRFARSLAYRGSSFRETIAELNRPYVNNRHQRNCRDAQTVMKYINGTTQDSNTLNLLNFRVPSHGTRLKKDLSFNGRGPLIRAICRYNNLDLRYSTALHSRTRTPSLAELADYTSCN